MQKIISIHQPFINSHSARSVANEVLEMLSKKGVRANVTQTTVNPRASNELKDVYIVIEYDNEQQYIEFCEEIETISKHQKEVGYRETFDDWLCL
jgi:type IV pilus biogenesis protein CpaD/CtpE